jgi:hypothetical protein
MAETRKGESLGERGFDIFFVLSHASIAILASALVESIHSLPKGFRLLIAGAYFSMAIAVYRWIKRRHDARKDNQVERWSRYEHLRSRMLDIVSEFLKQRYRTYSALAFRIGDHSSLDGESFCNALDSADAERREHIITALRQLSGCFVEDAFLKPDEPDGAIKDAFKVSVYVVEHDPAKQRERLLPKWRFYPNEGEPTTRGFDCGEGASGKAWQTKRVVVCEKGGDDPDFKDMWDGGGQKAHYASMICVPVMEQRGADRPSEVYGVITIDTPTRRGYFAKSLEQFWGSLCDPICRILIYCKEAEDMIGNLKAAAQGLPRRPVASEVDPTKKAS